MACGHAVRLPERQVCAEINLAPSYILLTFHLHASAHCIQETEITSLAVCMDAYHLLPHNPRPASDGILQVNHQRNPLLTSSTHQHTCWAVKDLPAVAWSSKGRR
ncbi:hypothetical protein AOLI_G00223140 [Acnodon oligacanthus]